MSAYTDQEEEVEITTEEHHHARLTELRKRKVALLDMPLEDAFSELRELQGEYITAGYISNAAAIGRRIGDVQ